MGDSFYVNHMTKAYHNFVKSYEIANRQQNTGKASFSEIVASTEDAASTESVGVPSTEEMTMEEYKEYIYDRICNIPIHPSQSGWHWNIEITDSGFEAMKNDPTYEKHVLDSIRANFSFADPFHSDNYSILHFGATEEESYGRSWGMGSRMEPKREEETFWERRAKRKKRLKEQYEEMQERKALEKRLQLRAECRVAAVERVEKGKLLQPWNQGKQLPNLPDAYETDIFINMLDIMQFLGDQA